MAHFYSDYETALKAAEQDLANLLSEQKRIEQEILNCRRVITSLVERLRTIKPVPPLTQSQEDVQKMCVEGFHRYTSEQSITEDVRKIIRSAGLMGIAKEAIRVELSKLGNSIEDHANPAGTVNSIVKRLAEKGEVEETPDQFGFNAVVKWKEPDFWQWLMEQGSKRK